MMLTGLLITVKENLADCGIFTLTSDCAEEQFIGVAESCHGGEARSLATVAVVLCLDVAYGKIQRMVVKPILLLPLGARPFKPDHVARST